MYFDSKPCRVCGAEVRLEPRDAATAETDPDETVDVRVCTNADCETNRTPGTGSPGSV